MFEAVILAGGLGTRLKSISGEKPKPMVEVAGKPFLYRLMSRLEQQGCNRIILSLGFRAEYIIENVKKDEPVKCEVLFSVEDSPLGTGGGIKKAASMVTQNKFVVLNGDSYSDIDYLSFFKAAENADLLISGVEITDVSRYGTLDLGKNNTVEQLVEKGRKGPGTINSGIYVISRNEILNFPSEVFSFESDFVQTYQGRFTAYVTDGYFIDIGIPEDYHKACEYFS